MPKEKPLLPKSTIEQIHNTLVKDHVRLRPALKAKGITLSAYYKAREAYGLKLPKYQVWATCKCGKRKLVSSRVSLRVVYCDKCREKAAEVSKEKFLKKNPHYHRDKMRAGKTERKSTVDKITGMVDGWTYNVRSTEKFNGICESCHRAGKKLNLFGFCEQCYRSESNIMSDAHNPYYPTSTRYEKISEQAIIPIPGALG